MLKLISKEEVSGDILGYPWGLFLLLAAKRIVYFR